MKLKGFGPQRGRVPHDPPLRSATADNHSLQHKPTEGKSSALCGSNAWILPLAGTWTFRYSSKYSFTLPDICYCSQNYFFYNIIGGEHLKLFSLKYILTEEYVFEKMVWKKWSKKKIQNELSENERMPGD